jgi:hypothetical protein
MKKNWFGSNLYMQFLDFISQPFPYHDENSPFPPSRMPASVGFSIKLVVCLMNSQLNPQNEKTWFVNTMTLLSFLDTIPKCTDVD